MGAHFSSQQLAGAQEAGNTISTSYAYSTYDTSDGTPSCLPQGYITPYLVPPAGPTLTCSGFHVSAASQSVKCPVKATSLTNGLYTLSFSQLPTCTSVSIGADGTQTVFQHYPTTLDDYGYDGVTFSITNPPTTSTSTVIITPTLTASTTVRSGVSEILPTSTATVPASVKTVTVYQTSIISTQISLSTLHEAYPVTITVSCPSSSSTSSHSSTLSTPTTMMVCNHDNCLRALLAKSQLATPFCQQYTNFKIPTIPTPTYASQCAGLASRVSSACSCLVQPTTKAKAKANRGFIDTITYAPPDFTFSGLASTPSAITVTSTADAVSTVTIDIPSTTVTDPNATATSGTSPLTDKEASNVTVTIYQSTVDSRTASTVTVTPASCRSPASTLTITA